MIDKTSIERAKKIVDSGIKAGRVMDVSEAFKRYPVEEEYHKGKVELFFAEEQK